MRFVTGWMICIALLAAALPMALAQEAPAPAIVPPTAPTIAPTTRSWLTGVSTRPAIIVPATKPTEERPVFSLSHDAATNTLRITFTNKGSLPVIVDSELIIPLYLTFFDDRDRPIRTEAAESKDPETGDLEKRFIKLEAGQSIDRWVDLSASFPVWVSGVSNTVFNEEERSIPFGRVKMRKLVAGAKVRRAQVAYAVMPPDREGIISYTNKSVEEWKLFTGVATADLRIADPSPPQP